MFLIVLPSGASKNNTQSLTYHLADDDTTPPEIYLHPENMTVLKNSGSLTLTWAVRDDVSSSGGYFIDVKIPEISFMWLTMQTFLWYSEQSITFDLDTSEEYTYLIRFKAHDEAINFAEHIIKIVIAKELDPPQIGIPQHMETEGGGYTIHYSVSDSTGISCIITSYTYDGLTWENLTTNIEEPENNKQVNGQVGLGSIPMRFLIYAEDYYGIWGKSDEIVVIEPSTTSPTTETSGTTTMTDGSPLEGQPVLLTLGVVIGVVVIIVIVIAMKRESPIQ